MNMGEKIDEMHKAAVVDLDLPMPRAVKGALEDLEKIKKSERPAKVKPAEPAGAKPAEKTMRPEAPEHPERSEDEAGYWYPAFKLKDNPFRHFEASLEEDVETAGPYIETDMERRIGALLNAKVSAIVKGPRGCGKSTLVSFGAGSKGANFIRVATPKNVTDLYDKIFLGLKPTVRDESAKEIWGDNLEKLIDYRHTRGTVGQESVCTLCRKRCPLPTPVYSSLETILAMFYIPPPCLARKTIAEYAVGFSPPDGCLLDIPDDADQGDVIALTQICVSMIQYSALIIFATDEQAKMLARSDAFSRLRVIEFEKPTEEFLIKLFKGRIDASGEKGGPYPFEGGVVKKIASISNYNAREFIHICSLVLVEMWMRKMTSPCTLEFLNELKVKPTTQGDRATIIKVLKRYEGKWMGIRELAQEFSEAVGAPYTGRKAGAMVRDFGFDQFKHDANGRSQVLISPNVLNAIVRAEDTEHSEDTEG